MLLTNRLVNNGARTENDTPPSPPATPIFDAAEPLFSARGFDGVSVDDIARDAGVNKAMIYYHFADKLALYRAVVGDGLRRWARSSRPSPPRRHTPPTKLDAFIEAFVRMTETRPWMPALMLREIAEGAPRLDADTMAHMRVVIVSFAAILKQGQDAASFATSIRSSPTNR